MWTRVQGLSLSARFLVTNLVVFVLATFVLGAWVGQQIEASVLIRTAGVTSLYVDSVVSPQLQVLARSRALDDAAVSGIDRLFSGTTFGERIVALKVWAVDGTILYSPNRELIGRRFPVEGGLSRAVAGDVAAEMSDLREVENVYERERWSRLVEVYAPVRADHGGPVIAVTEFYQPPDELEAEIRSAQLGSWAVVALTMAIAYALLAGIVRSGSDTIVRQARSLRERVDDLQRVLGENRRLQARVANAARSTTASTEQSLRRISADLHDGPAQALALVLLRLDEISEGGAIPVADAATLRGVVADALADLRSIASGLRAPDVGKMTLAEIATRATRDHEHRSGTHVMLALGALPPVAPLATKIALHRILQEALSNATRHGRARVVRVDAAVAAGALRLLVDDDGVGFSASPDQGLGIAGMRERAELLGGAFAIGPRAAGGTRVAVTLPLSENEE